MVNGRAKQIFGIFSSASLFDVLGVKPLLGLPFTAANMHAGSDDVVVISYALWRNSFGADPDIIGKTVKLPWGVNRIIGVMPRGFAFPDHSVALWGPYPITPQAFAPDRILADNKKFIGRLKPGVSLNSAEAQVQRPVALYVHDKVSATHKKMIRRSGFALGVQSYRQVLLGDRPATLWLLQGAVLLILLITCVNVANLLLSRILGRSHEMAMRSALGATRAMLAWQLLTEALCLTVPGGLAGVALAWVGLHFLAGSSLGSGESIFNVTLDWRVGLFAIGAVVFSAALVSVLPIRHLVKTDLQTVLQEGNHTSSGGRRTKRTRNALVIAELTLATGLLAMAGLVLHSFMNLEAVDPGFRKNHVLMAKVLVTPQDHPGNKALSRFYIDLKQRVNALPGVRNVAMATLLPLMGSQSITSRTVAIFIPGRTSASAKQPAALFNFVSPDYFKTLGIPVLRGRAFDARDTNRPTVIVDSGLVKKYFHGANPIGQQVRVGPGTAKAFGVANFTIVGVVPSIKYATLSTSAASTTIYYNDAHVTKSLGPTRLTTLVIHTAMSPSALIKPVQELIAGLDPNVAVYDVHTMHEQLADSLRDKQTTMTLLLAVGGIALALAIVGVYAVMSYAVGQRRVEFGVRLALGARPGDLLWLILKDGLKLLAIGLVIGLGLAVLFGYILSSQLFGVAPFDPPTLLGSAVMLCAITLAACYLPARRVAKLDPAVVIME